MADGEMPRWLSGVEASLIEFEIKRIKKIRAIKVQTGVAALNESSKLILLFSLLRGLAHDDRR